MNMTAIPVVSDWDNDGTLDLLVTSNFGEAGQAGVAFYKGMKGKDGYRFERGVPLFTTVNGNKPFPGDYLSVYVTDWNNDGINDLLIGTKMSLLNGVADMELNWTWDKDAGFIGKNNPGYLTSTEKRKIMEKIKNAERIEAEIGKDEMIKRKKESPLADDFLKYTTKEELLNDNFGGKMEYETMVHKGYVYLMLGEK